MPVDTQEHTDTHVHTHKHRANSPEWLDITDEGSRRLPKCLKFVTLLASVYEPQSNIELLALTVARPITAVH